MKNAGQMDNPTVQKARAACEERFAASQKSSEQLCARAGRVSGFRVATFAAAGLFVCLAFAQNSVLLFIPAAGLCIGFLLLLRLHGRLKEEQAHLEDVRSVLGDQIARFGDGWKSFPVDGARYISDDFLEARDLDLFGKGSLFQYMCTAGTSQGQDRLADLLCLAGKGAEKERSSREIRQRQQAVAELAAKPELCVELEAHARRFRDIGYDRSVEVMNRFFHAIGEPGHFPTVCRAFLKLFPAIALALLCATLFGIHRPEAMRLFFLLAFGQLGAVLIGLYRNNRALSPVYEMNRAIAPYRKLFALLEGEAFESPYFLDVQRVLSEDGTASAALKELEAISDAVCARRNVYAFVLYNGLFLHDFRCAERFARWRERYRGRFEGWLAQVGNVEALIGLSVICHTRSCCLPEIVDFGTPVFSVCDIRHPLLKETSAVGNDIALTHRTCVITGSNMSGKTTFLRSIGVNLALAYAGGFCTASGFRVSLMRLCTSIRAEDNVNEGISTFYAELLRIRRMIEASREETPLLCLIDEIYKGTNSRDRIFAAQETVRRLSKPWAFTLLSTHDFELCDLENDAAADAVNYHFAEYYEENEIRFDYKLRDGRCTTANARYLLRMAGILE